jgi:hypothetical protein
MRFKAGLRGPLRRPSLPAGPGCGVAMIPVPWIGRIVHLPPSTGKACNAAI